MCSRLFFNMDLKNIYIKMSVGLFKRFTDQPWSYPMTGAPNAGRGRTEMEPSQKWLYNPAIKDTGQSRKSHEYWVLDDANNPLISDDC